VKTQTEVKVAPDGKKLYMACAACHGAKAEKSALGKSKVIQGWSVVKIEDALKGYKDGSYGGAMKGIMKGQASKLSDDEMAAVAEYISKLH
jgi:cytochrome c553